MRPNLTPRILPLPTSVVAGLAAALALAGPACAASSAAPVGAAMAAEATQAAPGTESPEAGEPAASAERAGSLRVRCERRDRIGQALRHARAGDTLRISGTCREAVVVTTHGVRLLGLKGAVIDGAGQPGAAVLTVDGARGVTLENLRVHNGVDQGVLWMNGSQGVMKRVTATSNRTVGLSIDGSQVDLHEVNLDDNGGGGMDAYSASRVVAYGAISASHNGGDGLAVNAQTYFELRGAQVTAHRNAGTGVSVINGSRLQILSFPEAQGSGIAADDNGFAGIGVLGAQLGVVGSQFFGSGANVLRVSGSPIGFFMPAGAILSPHATAKFVAVNNGIGMLLEDGASALIVGGLEVNSNGTGISANGAGTLTLVSVPPNPSVVSANVKDVELLFGTRVTFGGVTLGTLSCDATVRVRGSSACP